MARWHHPPGDEPAGVHATLAALVPRPRLHLIRFHGVLAPDAKLRPMVVPQGPPADEEPAIEAVTAAECDVEHARAMPGCISWARLLERVFDIDMQHCPNCGHGQLKIIVAILERPVIEKILTHLGLDAQPAAAQGAGARVGGASSELSRTATRQCAVELRAESAGRRHQAQPQE